jgi:DNA uptake protein ComE-like DNA-binding protein
MIAADDMCSSGSRTGWFDRSAQRKQEETMQRTLIASLAVGLALSALGCAHFRHDPDRVDYKDYYERHTRDRNQNGLGGRLDLNQASTRELDDLPGLGPCEAHRILANRPYVSTRELVDRHIIEARQYDIIEDFIYACRVCPDRDTRHCPCGVEETRVIERRG